MGVSGTVYVRYKDAFTLLAAKGIFIQFENVELIRQHKILEEALELVKESVLESYMIVDNTFKPISFPMCRTSWSCDIWEGYEDSF